MVSCTRALMSVARCIYVNCFVGKYFVVYFSTTKTTKILTPEKYPLYGTRSVYLIYTVYTRSVYLIYTVYTRSVYLIYTVYTRSVYLIYTVYTRSVYLIYTVYTRSVYLIYTVYTRSVYLIYTVYTRSVVLIYTVYTRSGYLHQASLKALQRPSPPPWLKAPCGIRSRLHPPSAQ